MRINEPVCRGDLNSGLSGTPRKRGYRKQPGWSFRKPAFAWRNPRAFRTPDPPGPVYRYFTSVDASFAASTHRAGNSSSGVPMLRRTELWKAPPMTLPMAFCHLEGHSSWRLRRSRDRQRSLNNSAASSVITFVLTIAKSAYHSAPE